VVRLLLTVTAIAASLGSTGCSSGSAGGGSPGGGEAGGAPCVYPAGPYGTGVGDVVDPTLAWQGYVADAALASQVSIRDYFDCDGSRGVRALVLEESATWCGNCAQQAANVAPLASGSWKADGIALVVLMAQDQQGNPAGLPAALSWRNEYALTDSAVCADPAWTMKLWGGAPASGNGFPMTALVDPRTMKIVSLQPVDLVGTAQNLATSN
jgi:hypothetical protein